MRPHVLPIEPGDARTIGAVNAALTNIRNASVTLDALNFAEEGIDGRPIGNHAAAELIGPMVTEDTRAAGGLANTAGVFLQVNYSGTPFRTTWAPISLLAGERLRCRFRLFCESSIAAQVGIPAGAQFEARLQWNDGAATTVIPYTKRMIDKAPGVTTGLHGGVFCEGWLTGPIANIAWVEATYRLANGPVSPKAGMLWCTRFKRVKVL